MKPIRIVLSPTRSRPVNVFLGLVLLLVSLLLLLSLATYNAADPSLNTAANLASPHPVHNWIGLFGAWLSDLLLQALGLTAFFLPLWLGGIGWTWMHSRPSGSGVLRWIGTLLALVFLPTVFGLAPWHWRWLHLVPVEGVVGRLMSGLLVNYLNIQGAWLVAAVLAAAGLYFASAISFWVIKEGIEDRWLRVVSWHDRWKNWREERAEQREERRAVSEAGRAEETSPAKGQQFIPGTDPNVEPEQSVRPPSRLAALFGRRDRNADSDPVDDIPAFRRTGIERAEVEEQEIPITPPVRKSIWERSEAETAPPAGPVAVPQNVVPMPAPPAQPRPAQPQFTESRPAAPRFESEPAPAPRPIAEIAIHGRADAEMRTATVAPKNVSGFKLPPSTLLNPGDGPQKVREDELREEAKVLVEKCGEFDVRGQVVQINPGPMVTTYEFKPEAGVKYSRVTGLADDLCLAMRAESILIERMAGKSTVGIQVPNHERETIHLRDVLESETFHKAKSRLTLAMGKDINGRIVTADLGVMPHILIAGSTGSGKSVAINAMIKIGRAHV